MICPARDLKPGDIVSETGQVIESVSWADPLRFMHGPEGTKNALHLRIRGDQTDYFVYPSSLLEITPADRPLRDISLSKSVVYGPR